MVYEHTTMIFSTDSGIVAIDSPVKLKILELLRKGTMTFENLVEESEKAKSTISVHLDDLERLSLIREKTFPNDKRKKYFVLNSTCFACSEIPLLDLYQKQLDNIVISSTNGDSFIKHIYNTVRYGMEAHGFDPNPILKKLGNDIGTKIGPEFKSDDYEGILNELTVFWKIHKLGNMTIIYKSEPEILVLDCYHCGKMSNVGKTLCSMDEGILEGIFLSRLNIELIVREIECYGTGHHHCRFVMEEK
ncbi:MAG TPA: V4R domain-containing protein [Candidatus Methanoperedens sp.]